VSTQPPKPPPPAIENIPAALKELRRWLVWRFSRRPNSKGKHGKVPYNVADRKADYTDSDTWLSFESAVQQYWRGEYDGIGIVLGDGVCGLDEDHCFSSDSRIDPEAARHIQHLNTYTERSLSGGIHALALGSLPPSGRKRGNHEIYCERRFFVVTGWHLPGTPTLVANRERELHEVHAMIFASPNFGTPPKVSQNSALLHRGGEGERESESKTRLSDEAVIELVRRDQVANRYWQGCPKNVNASDADFALACKLAFYTAKNQAQMCRLFRQSGLANRAKTNTRRGGMDYVHYTIQRACKAQRTVWRPRHAQQHAPSTAVVNSRRPGRPECQVEPRSVLELHVAGKSLREIARALEIGKTTAAGLLKIAIAQQNAPSCVPKISLNYGVSEPRVGHVPDKERSGEWGMPIAEWKAGELNRLFRDQGVSGQPGAITAETVRHGERR
jgi:putative DNA primase/helicase